jgi:hypothetical protein
MVVGAYGHGWRKAAEDVAEAPGLAPGRHLGTDEDDVHAGRGAHHDGRAPSAPALLRPLRLLRGRARAGPHAERGVRWVPWPRTLEATAPEQGWCRSVGDAEDGARGGELGCGQSRHAAHWGERASCCERRFQWTSEGLSELNRRIRSIFLEGLNGTYLNTEIQTST